jgi:PPOX class probable F420-dependent enzyme
MEMLTSTQRDFLNGVDFAVVATIRDDGLPHQTVMWYALQLDDTILLNTPFESLKHRHLRNNPQISVCIEDGYRYITLRGKFEINEDTQQSRQDYLALGKRYRDTFHPILDTDSSNRPAILDRDRVTLKLTIEYINSNGF